jgi:hypothetical protein
VQNHSRRLICAAVGSLSFALALAADAKTRTDCERDYRPQRGQDGKDVIWVPTADAMVTRMLEMAKVTPSDTVYDLGAGDGVIPIAAGKRFGATAVGIEYDPDLAKHAQCLVEAEGVQDRVKVVQGDIFEIDFSAATVVTLYLLPALNLRLRPALLAMPPGTRVVSYSFTMGDWDPDDTADTDDGSAYLWIVPAVVEGAWTFQPTSGGSGFDATLDQTFQTLRATVDGFALAGKVTGTRVEFAFRHGGAAATFSGVVTATGIEGTVARGTEAARYVGTRR